MKPDSLSARLRAAFLAELEDQVRVMNADLLALEREPANPERLKSLFRVAHTLKGAARAGGVPEVERACHGVESVLARARAGVARLDASTCAVLFKVADAMADARERLARGDDLAGAAIASVALELDGLHVPSRTGPPAPVLTAKTQARESAPPPATAAARPASAANVRIDAGALDVVLAAATELRQGYAGVQAAAVAARSALASPTLAAGERALNELDERLRTLAHAVDDVAVGAARLRMRPFSEICEGLPRMVRDLAAEERKNVEVVLEGAAEEADRAVLDALREPIVHLVRNAVSHGIEVAPIRAAAGKPASATVTVGAALRGGRFVVTVADDGGGIDAVAARNALARAGREAPDDDAALGRALLEGGVSTRAVPGMIAGRGVGLDVVRSAVERIGGFVHVDWSAGRGTTFTLDCPPALATIRVVLVDVGGHVIAIPTAATERMLRVSSSAVTRAQGRDVLVTPDGAVPIAPLARVLGAPFIERAAADTLPVVQLRAADRRAAFVVDALIDECEVTVRPLDTGQRLPLLLGAALTDTGVLAAVLNPVELLSQAIRIPSPLLRAVPEARPRHRVLVVDDSITTRTLEQHVLEAAGYDAFTAVDGAEAWRLLQERPVDLVVSDVEMPRMDGFSLCREIRGSPRFAKLPVVLVTALESPEQRARGLEVGANAYIGKSSFDQQTLLDVIRQFLA